MGNIDEEETSPLVEIANHLQNSRPVVIVQPLARLVKYEKSGRLDQRSCDQAQALLSFGQRVEALGEKQARVESLRHLPGFPDLPRRARSEKIHAVEETGSDHLHSTCIGLEVDLHLRGDIPYPAFDFPNAHPVTALMAENFHVICIYLGVVRKD